LPQYVARIGERRDASGVTTKLKSGNLKRRDHSADQEVDGRIINYYTYSRSKRYRV
jgi:hypothetical protein